MITAFRLKENRESWLGDRLFEGVFHCGFYNPANNGLRKLAITIECGTGAGDDNCEAKSGPKAARLAKPCSQGSDRA